MSAGGKAIGFIILVGTVILFSWLLRPRPADAVATHRPLSANLQHPSHDTSQDPSDGADPPSNSQNASVSRNAPLSRDGVENGSENEVENGSDIVLLGAVEPESQHTVSTRTPTRIDRVVVKEGDAVSRGALLLEFDGTELVGQMKVAAAGVVAARSNLGKAEAGQRAQAVKADADVASAEVALSLADSRVRQATLARDAGRDDGLLERQAAVDTVHKAESAAQMARRSLESLEALAGVGGAARNDIEAARTQRDTAEADLNAARTQLARLDAGPDTGSGNTYRVALAQKDIDAAILGAKEAADGLAAATRARVAATEVAKQDVGSAAAALKQSQSAYEAATVAAGETKIVSAIDGVVTDLTAHAGDIAQPGAALMTVVSLGALRVDALASARVLPQLHVGETAAVQVDTYPGRSFRAVISEVSRVAEPDGRSFRIHFHLTGAAGLRPGQSTRIRIAHR